MYGLHVEEVYKEPFHPDRHPATQAVIDGLAKAGIKASSESKVDPHYTSPIIRVVVGSNPVY